MADQEVTSTPERRVGVLAKHAAASTAAQAGPGGTPRIAWRFAGMENPNLREERAKTAFPLRQITNFLDGGEHISQYKEAAMADLEADPVFRIDDRCHLTTEQQRQRVMKKVAAMWQRFMQDGTDLERRYARLEVATLHDPAWATRNGVHYGLWMGAVQGQGSDAQQAEYLGPSMMLQLFGCFGMTELGHGSYIRGLETEARFDRATDSFVINTPSLTATKWWIGGAAHTSTHCAVFARLLVGDKDHGVHTFVVPLRSMEDHSLLPGVVVGDCGEKLGRNGIDNGWIQFHHVRVPRDNMLCRYAQVDREGNYTRAAKAQLAYGALIGGRGHLINDSAAVLKVATTIAVRYALVRRQGEPPSPGDEAEVKVLDYQAIQRRLMPLVAAAYAFNKVAGWMKSLQEGLDEDQSTLPDVHSTSAGLKSYCTWFVYDAIDLCRQTLGGHGYSRYTRLGDMHADFAVMCTWEGDNTVMALQTSRYLVGQHRAQLRGEQLVGSVRYLSEEHPRSWHAASIEEACDVDLLLEAFRFLVAGLVRECAEDLDSKEAAGMTPKQAWNATQVSLVRCSQAHCAYNVVDQFWKAIGQASVPTRDVLAQLCALFALHVLDSYAADLQRLHFWSGSQAKLANEAMLRLCASTRAQAAGLTDAFNLSDFIIGSPMGRWDGDVYSHYFETVRSYPGQTALASYYEQDIAPVLRGEHSPEDAE